MNNERSGGVYCATCNKCISPPRKRKNWQPDCHFLTCEECEYLISNPELCNTDPQFHKEGIAKILMKHKCFTPQICNELGRFILNFKLKKKVFSPSFTGFTNIFFNP